MPRGIVAQTPGSSATTSSCASCFRHSSPRPERTNHSSSTVRCVTARDVAPAHNSKWAIVARSARSNGPTADPSGASSVACAERSVVAKQVAALFSFIRRCRGALSFEALVARRQKDRSEEPTSTAKMSKSRARHRGSSSVGRSTARTYLRDRFDPARKYLIGPRMRTIRRNPDRPRCRCAGTPTSVPECTSIAIVAPGAMRGRS